MRTLLAVILVSLAVSACSVTIEPSPLGKVGPEHDSRTDVR